jgi:hypothetical protein
MRAANLSILASLVLAGFCALAAPQSPLLLKIAPVEAEVKSRSEVRVEATLTNTSDHDITIELTSRLLDYEVQVYDSKGRLTRETDVKLSVEHPGTVTGTGGRDAFVTLKPSQSRKEQLAVSQYRDMSQPDEYSVQVMRKAPSELGGAVVKSNVVKITVTP